MNAVVRPDSSVLSASGCAANVTTPTSGGFDAGAAERVSLHPASKAPPKAIASAASIVIDGQRIETIEVSLSQLKVIQSRGICNKNTEHHSRIINLVESNIPLIEERLVA